VFRAAAMWRPPLMLTIRSVCRDLEMREPDFCTQKEITEMPAFGISSSVEARQKTH
jgi:hypothetical protein